MKKSHIFLLVLMLASAFQAAAQVTEPYQNTQVTLSSEKTVISGKVYYIHTVLPKQTIYSICKTYGVTYEELLAANSSLADGLKADTVIFIPCKQEQVQEEEEQVVESASADNWLEHRVKWYEQFDIRIIARKYGVSAEDIKAANGLGDSNAVKSGLVLKIPVSDVMLEEETIPQDAIEEIPENDEEVVNKVADDDGIGDWDLFNRPFSGKVNMGILLPFAANTSKPSSNYLDFYSGVLLAVEEFKREGIDIELNVADVASGLSEAMLQKNFAESNFVIGPVSPADIRTVIPFFEENDIPLVSPLDQKAASLTKGNSHLIQVPVSQWMVSSALAKSISAHEPVLVVYENGVDTAYRNSIVNELRANDIPYSTLSYNILNGRGAEGAYMSKMSKTKKNHVIIASEQEAFASDAVRNLKIVAGTGEYEFDTYCSHKLRNFGTIEADALHEVNAHMLIAYAVDYSKADVKQFVRRYRALFKAEPTAFSFQGYDIAYCFISAYKRYGRNFPRKISGHTFELLQSDMRFFRDNKEDGLRNEAVRHILYSPGYNVEYRSSQSNSSWFR